MAIALPANLCGSCYLIFSSLTVEPSSRYTRHKPSVADLEKSAETCPACLVIWTWITPTQRTQLLQAEAAEAAGECTLMHKSEIEMFDTEASLELQGGVFWEETSVQMLSFAFYCPVIDRCGLRPISWEMSFRIYTGPNAVDWKPNDTSSGCDSTSGESTLRQIRSWLQECQETHTSCKKLQDADWLPTRLIEIGANEDRVRLRSGSDLPPGTRYLALSHCWGRKEAIKLTSDTYNEFFKEIPMDRLPKTFRDAVDITKRLGYVYLWIDCLCIIQGDRADWDRECGMMERVYSNCVLDIAALHSEDGFGGCYKSRNPSILNDVLVEIDNRKVTTRLTQFYGSEESDREQSDKEVFRLISQHHYWHSLLQGPLNTRAWVLQETFLAPRVVYFCENMVAWDCTSLLATEAEPKGVYERFVGSWSFLRGKADMSHDATISMWPQWDSLVATYMKRKRTVYEDKLVAFAGIAKLFQVAFTKLDTDTTPEYLAGLWSQDLELQLTWTRDPSDDSEIEAKQRGYIAPSWSWASLECQVRLSTRGDWEEHAGVRHRILTKVQGYSIAPLGTDPFLQVSSGSLYLHGWLWKPSSKKGLTVPAFMDDLRGRLIPGMNTSPEEEEEYLDMYLLPVKFSPKGDDVSFDCLCLQPTGFRAGQFKRIGQASFGKPRDYRQRKDVVESESDGEESDVWERPTSDTASQYRLQDQALLQECLKFHWETKSVIKPIAAEDNNFTKVENDPEEYNGLTRCKYTIELV